MGCSACHCSREAHSRCGSSPLVTRPVVRCGSIRLRSFLEFVSKPISVDYRPVLKRRFRRLAPCLRCSGKPLSISTTVAVGD